MDLIIYENSNDTKVLNINFSLIPENNIKYIVKYEIYGNKLFYMNGLLEINKGIIPNLMIPIDNNNTQFCVKIIYRNINNFESESEKDADVMYFKFINVNERKLRMEISEVTNENIDKNSDIDIIDNDITNLLENNDLQTCNSNINNNENINTTSNSCDNDYTEISNTTFSQLLNKLNINPNDLSNSDSHSDSENDEKTVNSDSD